MTSSGLVPDNLTSLAMFEEIRRRGWKVSLVEEKSKIYQVTDAKGRCALGRDGRLSQTNFYGVIISWDKYRTYRFLEKLGYQAPGYMLWKGDKKELESFLSTHHEVVVKPTRGEQGDRMSKGLRTTREVTRAAKNISTSKYKSEPLVQEQLSGKVVRVLVVNGKFFAASYGFPAFVVGNGSSTVRQLIDIKNRDPMRQGMLSPLSKIEITDVRKYISSRVLRSVPAEGEIITVSPSSNMSKGGESEDVTERVHPDYRATLEHIARVLGLSLCGFDLIVEDISKPPVSARYLPLLEINSLPGFRSHLYPTLGGKRRNPAPTILDFVFED